MKKEYTTAEVAAALDLSPRRVRALAADRGRGRKLAGRLVFSAADLVNLSVRTPGRPTKGSH
ncbi:MAG: hypothetical protein ABFD89_16625 [Bryobacteraceae bacterium]